MQVRVKYWLVRFAGAVVVALAALPPGAQDAVDYVWRQIVPTGRGAFEDAWRPGRWPMAVHPLVGPSGDSAGLFMLGSQRVYWSADGIRWTSTTDAAPWREAYAARSVVFRGALYSLGGQTGNRYSADVWRSPNGKEWRHTAAPWPARRNAGVTVFRDRLWLLGGRGDGLLADVWSSADGIGWERILEHAPWSRRVPHGVVAFRDSLWLLGGGPWEHATADVWVSGDGKRWTQITDAVPWGARIFPGVVVFDDRLWVIGGVRPNGPRLQDVWSSADGRTWTQARAPWTPRAGEHVVVFQNALWLYGGKGKEEDMSSGYAGDIWRLERRTSR